MKQGAPAETRIAFSVQIISHRVPVRACGQSDFIKLVGSRGNRNTFPKYQRTSEARNLYTYLYFVTLKVTSSFLSSTLIRSAVLHHIHFRSELIGPFSFTQRTCTQAPFAHHAAKTNMASFMSYSD